jgi:hypothetical protein
MWRVSEPKEKKKISAPSLNTRMVSKNLLLTAIYWTESLDADANTSSCWKYLPLQECGQIMNIMHVMCIDTKTHQ